MSLTDEDKQWILDRMKEQTNYAHERIEHVEAKLLTQMSSLHQKLEAMEARLVTEFQKWASPFEARQRSHSAAIRAFDAEIESLTERVEKLEKPHNPNTLT